MRQEIRRLRSEVRHLRGNVGKLSKHLQSVRKDASDVAVTFCEEAAASARIRHGITRRKRILSLSSGRELARRGRNALRIRRTPYK